MARGHLCHGWHQPPRGCDGSRLLGINPGVRAVDVWVGWITITATPCLQPETRWLSHCRGLWRCQKRGRLGRGSGGGFGVLGGGFPSKSWEERGPGDGFLQKRVAGQWSPERERCRNGVTEINHSLVETWLGKFPIYKGKGQREQGASPAAHGEPQRVGISPNYHCAQAPQGMINVDPSWFPYV